MRQIHLDFHTSEQIDGVGADFDGAQFARTLRDAHVDSVILFSRCHHGWVYYDSTVLADRRHPHLARNLLAEQIEACHTAGISVSVYTTVQWDIKVCRDHPEWRVLLPDGQLEGTPPFEAGFYRMLCLNTPFRNFITAAIRELVETLPLDGIYLDFVRPYSCVCQYCLRGMGERGFDPENAAHRSEFGVATANEFELETSAMIRSIRPDCAITYNGGHIGTRHRDAAPAYDRFEMETLPSGGWGYLYFPVTGRYARTLGPAVVGTTGKFHTTWGDFHSLKSRPALEYECFRMLSLGAGCSIGDQLHPRGVLDAEAYAMIGEVYRRVEALEPWCRDVRPVTDIAVVHPELVLGGRVQELPPGIQGVTRMLEELGHQFDIVDDRAALTDYRVAILPDHITLDQPLTERIRSYLAGGGSVLASFESGLSRDKSAFVLDELGVTMIGDGNAAVRGKAYPRNDHSDYLRDRAGAERPTYSRGVAIAASPDAEVLAETVASYFDRSWRRFSSHLQAPSSGRVVGPAIVGRGRCVYFAHAVFTQYERNAPPWFAAQVAAALDRLLPDPVVRHNGPSTVQVTVNAQQNRWVVHVLHYIPERRAAEFDTVNDVIPLHDLTIRLRIRAAVRAVTLEPSGERLPYQEKDGGLTLTLPRVEGHALVCVQFAD
jgi:hypothetical protein